MNIRRNVIVQVSNDDREEHVDEEYYIAKIEWRALKLDKAGVYSSVLFQKNDWMFLCVSMSLFLQSRMKLLGTGSTLKEEPSGFHAIQSSDA